MAFVTSGEIKRERSTNPEERKVLKTKWSCKTFSAFTIALTSRGTRDPTAGIFTNASQKSTCFLLQKVIVKCHYGDLAFT